MSFSFSFGRVSGASSQSTGERPDPETPFRILVLGDFSGRTGRGLCEPGTLGKRRPMAVDVDNFNQVMARLGVEVQVPVAGTGSLPVVLRCGELDDFHPDRIFEQAEVFGKLRELRRLLLDPRTYDSAAAEVRAWTQASPGKTAEPPAAPPAKAPQQSPPLSPEDMLGQLLQETDSTSAPQMPLTQPGGWDAFLAEIVAPYVVARPDPQQVDLVAAVDDAAAGLMRSLLHNPDFQAVESAWRGAFFLVSRLELDTQLTVFLLDVSKEELRTDLTAAEDLRAAAIYKRLVDATVNTPGAVPWAILAADYTFDLKRDDAELLGRMAKVARAAGAPLLAGATAHTVGCESLVTTPDPREWDWQPAPEDRQAWDALRALPEASWLGLALPRFLLRLPYGPETDVTERFSFREMPGEPVHAAYLWGNPCFACAYLLGATFRESGWGLQPGDLRDIGDLPIHTYKVEGETEIKPCAEAWLTERAMEAILDRGVMPLLSFVNQGAVRLARFQSLADPPTRLAGRWE